MNEREQHKKELIERIGIYYEKEGLQPVPARVIGLLLVTEESELTFDQIREELGVSKSATSNAINLLIRTGTIEYITKPGDRKRYFRNILDHWKGAFNDRMNSSFYLIDLLKEVKSITPTENKQKQHSLKELIGFMDYMRERLPQLLLQWQNEKKK